MPEQHIVSGARRRARWIVLATAVAIVGGRSAVFLIWPQSYFDSDQAIVGLMAKHLAERRAFPLFLYGQTYMLGVEAWLAAPLFAIFGVSATLLKLPLLAMNVVIALALVTAFVRDMALTWWLAAVASLPFLIPSPGITAVFLDASGGSVEPLLYVVLLWMTRRHPLWCGLVFGIGFLNREFTVYGLAALVCIDAIDRRLFTRDTVRHYVKVLAVAAVVWIAVQGLESISSGSGPGTTIRDTFTASNNLAEVAGRVCISPAKTAAGVRRLFSEHWPAVFGTGVYPLTTFSIESRVTQGLAGSSWLVVMTAALGVVAIALGSRRGRPAAAPRLGQYLILAAVFSVAGYIVGRCGEVSFYSMRYDMLSVLGGVGLAGWVLSTHPPLLLRAAWLAAFGVWIAIQAGAHVRLATEYASDPPVPAKQLVIRALDAQGIRYGRADYWLAYYIDFMTNERIVLASEAPQRILLYNKIVDEHAAEAVRLSRRRCSGGTELAPGVYRCP